MKEILTYDRADESGELFAMASAIELPLVRQADQNAAVSKLFESKASILLVHLNPDPWKNLCNETSKLKDRFVFRFSTQGFPPTPPCGPGKNCFHVNRPTKGTGAFTTDQLEEFIEALKQDGVLPALLAGTIPTVLRPFIQFREPHLARALHMVLQGRLAQWALDPGHPLQAQAGEDLGFDTGTIHSSRAINWPGIVRKLLSSEMPSMPDGKLPPDAELIQGALTCIRKEVSQKKDSMESPIKEIADLLEKWLQITPASDETSTVKQEEDLFPLLKSAFNALNVALGRTREEAS
jgi:hypothetical protein